MKTRMLLLALLSCAMAFSSRATDTICDICGQAIVGKYYHMEDHAAGGEKNVCRDCADLEDRCFACGLPVKKDFKTLADGRNLCARDAAEAIESREQFEQICETVHDDLNHLLWRFLTLPDKVPVAMVDKFQLQNLFRTPGYERACVSVFGATQSHPLHGGKFVHSISILSHLKKSRLMAVCAHEYTHTWLNETLRPERKAVLDSKAEEGFCELVAYKYMDSLHEAFEMETIKTSDYTKGQISLMLDAEALYGFNAIIEWMKAGEDPRLEKGQLDRVRALNPSYGSHAVASAGLLPVPVSVAVAPPPAPDRLVLKGISGVGPRRLAIINDQTFEAMERGKVRVAQTNVLIRCLEIRPTSVVVQAEGQAKQELFLRTE
jgi:hypothetical protein